MNRVDIAIIGTGPAGVSAAVTARVRGKQVLLFGSGRLSDKMTKAHSIRNYTGLPDIPGAQLAEAMLSHLKAMEVSITEEQVTAVYAMGDYFAIQTPAEMYEASSVILATGVVMSKTFPGEDEFLGRGVSYCATCDAHFYKGKTVIVLGYNEESCVEADFLAETSGRVIYIPVVPHEVSVGAGVEVMQVKPTAILGGLKAEAVEIAPQASGADQSGAGAGRIEADGIFILRDAVAPDKLVPGIETDGSHVRVDLMMRTSLPGCFACGDVAGRPYQYIKAAGQGNVAALSAVSWLAEQKTGR